MSSLFFEWLPVDYDLQCWARLSQHNNDQTTIRQRTTIGSLRLSIVVSSPLKNGRNGYTAKAIGWRRREARRTLNTHDDWPKIIIRVEVIKKGGKGEPLNSNTRFRLCHYKSCSD
ncbi:hypothetical protein V9T40_008950 [Parthenolecanium corni]|uniref:Uncharacterized protein n=1 Tax=Parthenolecanium corni TaxID=536013 RepID=A0AAN9TLT1_9HEMI